MPIERDKMSSELNLSKLSKSPFVRSLKFKRTTPGSFTRLIAPVTASVNDKIVDSSHPFSKRHPTLFANTLPTFRDPALTVRVFPKPLLGVPPIPRPDPPYSMAKETNGRLNMSLMHVIPKKLHKSSVIRTKIKNRLKTAVSLMATRGARTEMEDDQKLIVGGPDNTGAGWILSNWTYLFMPKLEVYRMPYEDLVDLVRQAMEKVYLEASAYDNAWSNMGDTLQGQRQPLDKPPHLAGIRFDTRSSTKPTGIPPTTSDATQSLFPAEEHEGADSGDSDPYYELKDKKENRNTSSASQLLFRNRPLLKIEPGRNDRE